VLQPNLSVEIGGFQLRNPIIAESGPVTRDGKAIKKAALCGAGAVVTKTICLEACKVPRPCMAKFQSGLLNAETGSDLPYEDWITKEIKTAKEGGVPIIASISPRWGPEGVEKMASDVTLAGADMIEFGAASPKRIKDFVKAARKATDAPIIVKLSITPYQSAFVGPQSYDVVDLAKIAEKAKVDAIALSDSFGPCLRIDIETGKPLLGKLNGTCRMTGAPVKPFVTYSVYRIARAVKTPVIGEGGVMTGGDAVETLMAGATGVGVCTAAILNGPEVLGKIVKEVESFLEEKNVKNIRDIIGVTIRYINEKEEKGIVAFKGQTPLIDTSLCNACGLCKRSCIYGAITINRVAEIDETSCYGCGLCFSVCPTKAISLRY
jgi:dihydroorotate dehydrogenase (NAD+) catalytic subunit